LSVGFSHGTGNSFPHARGDVKSSINEFQRLFLFSPRTWGCKISSSGLNSSKPRFPHARGGEPLTKLEQMIRVKFSPRTWGWKSKFLSAFS